MTIKQVRDVLKVGDSVYVKESVDGQYSNYGGKPALQLKPGNLGTVMAIRCTTVWSSNRPYGEFVSVAYVDGTSGCAERAAVSYDNLILRGNV